MSIKLVDSLQSMGDFPVAFANSIECADGTDLETKLSTLGSGGGAEAFVQLSQEEYDNLEDSIKLDGREFRTYDTGHIYQLGVEYGKETDITGKQDNLNQVKFTIRRNSVNEPRYCMIASSDLSQNLLMCEPYRFKGIFGSSTESVEKKSLIDLYVSFREGAVADKVMKGYADSSEAFDYVDLIITVDEATNRSYAYVDFLTSGSMCSGEITVPVLDAEKYMTFAESFELVDSMIGTELCRMSDYCKVITEISDEVSDSTVWSSKKTSDEIDALISDTSSTTSTYSSAKIDTELAKKPTKYSKTYAGTHSRYIKIGSIPVSSGIVSKATLLISLFSASEKTEEYPVGFLNINISSGANNNRFNINGTTTISLNSTNVNHPRIVVDKTSTHYNLYVDCSYNYMWIDYIPLQTDQHYVNGNFEELDALEGTEYWSSVTSDDIKYLGSLKTNSNTDLTSVTFNSTYATATSGGHGCTYIVRNGICYVNMDMRIVANGKICTLPKPLMSVVNIPMTVFMHNITGEVEAVNNGILMVNSDGSATTLGALTNESRYMMNFSYPIA